MRHGRLLAQRRLPADDLEVGDDLHERLAGLELLDAREQQVDRRRRDLLTPGRHRGQRRGRVGGLLDVVEADHRDLPRDVDPPRVQRVQGAQREGVVQAEHGVDLDARVQQPFHRLGARRAVPQPRLADQRRVHRQAGLLERLPVALHAQRGRAHGLALVRTDHGDAPAPQVEQVLRGGAGGLDVVHGDVVRGSTEDALTEQHHREVDVQRLGVLRPELERREDQPVGEVPTLPGEHVELALAHGPGLLDEDGQATGLGRADDRVGELREVRERQLRHGEPDDPGPTAAQVPRRDVHLVPEVGDGRLDPFLGGGPDVLVPVDHVGDGLDRHPCPRGDLVHRHRGTPLGRAHRCLPGARPC